MARPIRGDGWLVRTPLPLLSAIAEAAAGDRGACWAGCLAGSCTPEVCAASGRLVHSPISVLGCGRGGGGRLPSPAGESGPGLAVDLLAFVQLPACCGGQGRPRAAVAGWGRSARLQAGVATCVRPVLLACLVRRGCCGLPVAALASAGIRSLRGPKAATRCLRLSCWVLGESLVVRPAMAMPFGCRFSPWRHLSLHIPFFSAWIFWMKT